MAETTTPPSTPEKFPPVFWVANITELFERSAYYSMATFVVIYLGQLGLGTYWPAMLNTLLWTLVYFLPILSGAVADHIGYRRALLGAGVVLTAGYLLLGSPVWFGGTVLSPTIERQVTAGAGVVLPVVLGIVLVGFGGSIVKPCVLGTTQKTAGSRATLAYALFYLIVNIGALFGRFVAYYVRTRPGAVLASIFAVAAGLSVLAFLTVAPFFKEPKAPVNAAPAKPKRSVGEILLGMVTVLSNVRFVIFLLVASAFYLIYNQFYVVVPLYLKTVVEHKPAMDIYTMSNPLVIVSLQLVITRKFGKLKPVRSMMIGCGIVSTAMALNVLPILTQGDVRGSILGLLPMGALLMVSSFALCAFAELFTSPRMYEYVGALAPKGQEGLFLGYANLPLALGSLAGGPVGALIFNEIMVKGATRRPDGLLDLAPNQNATAWLILAAVGVAAAIAMWGFDRWTTRAAVSEAAR